jgi:hypothetical protein
VLGAAVGSLALTLAVALLPTATPAGAQVPPTTPFIGNVPLTPGVGDQFTALVVTDSDGTPTVTTSTPATCTVSTVDNLTVTFVGAGTCTLTAHTAGTVNFDPADGDPQDVSVGQGTPTTPSVSDLPAAAAFDGSFVATVATDSDGTPSVTSSTSDVCTVSIVDNLTVDFVGVGQCTLTAHVAASANYVAADGDPQTFAVAQAVPTTPTITDLPSSAGFGGNFVASVDTNGDGTTSVTSGTTDVCTVSSVDNLTVDFVGVGQCTLTAHVASGTDYAAADGTAQSFDVGQATPTPPTVTDLPSGAVFGGSFVASVDTNGDGTTSVASDTTDVCTVGPDGLTVSFVGVGTCTLTPQVADGIDYGPATGTEQSFDVGQATPTPPTVTDLPSGAVFGGNFVASVDTNGDGTTSVTSSTTDVCTVGPDGLTVSFVGVGTCTLTPQVADGIDYGPATGTEQSFAIGQATPSSPTITDLPAAAGVGDSFVAAVATNGDGTTSVISSSTAVCTVGPDGLTVSFIAVGNCMLTAQVADGTDYTAATGTMQSVTVSPGMPSLPTITNLPAGGAFGGGFTATVNTTGDGAKQVMSTTTSVCTVSNGLQVAFVAPGTCTLTAEVGAGTQYQARNGMPQSFAVGRAVPSTPTVTNVPNGAVEFGSFAANVGTNGDGPTSVASQTTNVCTVGPDGHTVTFVLFGTCTLSASLGQGNDYLGAAGGAQSFPVTAAPRGYWLVGSDGGIFNFGAAGFFGSTGSLQLQRPVVGIVPTKSRQGYWLDASDGGIFSFGDAGFFGSIPGLGYHPAGSGLPNSLNAPIVGMVPSSTGQGYFMVASDGGVFAFGDAKFAGSCPGIGGCSGSAVAVMPDHSGNGYWLVTSTGAIYAFGDAPYFGGPPPEPVAVVDAVPTPDGQGYWLLYANGAVYPYGDAVNDGGPLGYVNIYNPARAIFPTADGVGYWVASAKGDVFSSGDAPFLGSMSSTPLNGQIIAGYGF